MTRRTRTVESEPRLASPLPLLSCKIPCLLSLNPCRTIACSSFFVFRFTFTFTSSFPCPKREISYHGVCKDGYGFFWNFRISDRWGGFPFLVSLTQPHLTNPFHTHLLLLLLFFWQYSQFDLNCFYMVDGDCHHDHDRDQLLFLPLPFRFSEQFPPPSAPRRTNGIPFVTVHRLFFFLVKLDQPVYTSRPRFTKVLRRYPLHLPSFFFITVSFFWPPCVGRAANVRVCATRRPSFYPFYPYPLGAAFFFLLKKKHICVMFSSLG